MDKQTLDDLGDLTLGDLARKSVEIELSGIKMPSGFTRFIKAIERIVLPLRPLSTLANTLWAVGIRLNWRNDILLADADLPSEFLERAEELSRRRRVRYLGLVATFEPAATGYKERVGLRRLGGRTRVRGQRRRKGDVYIIACLLRINIQNLSKTSPDRSQISAMAEAFDESL